MKHEFCRSRRVLSTEAERNEVMIAAVLVYSVNSYEFLKDEISPCLNEISFRQNEISSCRHEMSMRNFVSRHEISFRFITLLANNMQMPPKRRRFCNLFSEIHGFRKSRFITFAQYCIYRVIWRPFWSHEAFRITGRKLLWRNIENAFRLSKTKLRK